MKALGIYTPTLHNESNGIIKYRAVEFWFGGLDDPQRIHGFASDIFWINEANEATREDFDQLEMRCAGFGILDYNPNISDDHWLTKAPQRDDATLIHSTLINNPFAPENVVKKIRSYEPTEYNYAQGTVDKNKWEIYGLGKRAVIEGLYSRTFSLYRKLPNGYAAGFYGIDFGYTNDQTAIVEVGITDTEIWVDEKCYLTYQLTGDIVKQFKALPALKTWSESADPRLLAEISLAGINIHPASKPTGSVLAGIGAMQSKRICVTERSINTIREFRNYTYQQNKDGKWMNQPIDDFNHAIDAIRYVVYMEQLGKCKKKTDLSQIFH